MNKLRVAILCGGPSREHDISVKSGKAMAEAICKDKYEVREVFIDRQSVWHINDLQISEDKAIDWLKDNVDFVLIGLHGTFGEDGGVQKLLEKRKIPFSGSDSKSSRLAMHKSNTAMALRKKNILVPHEEIYSSTNDALQTKMKLPFMVKPASQGSSVGITKIHKTSDLKKALEDAFNCDDKVLIQEYIHGREFSCGVIENEQGVLTALPATELVLLKSDFFDFDAKYTEDATKEITPPEVDEDTHKSMQNLALQTHQALGCSGYSRTDIIMDKNKKLYVIELNTLPGFTQTSILPQEAKVAGISINQVLDLIISAGLKRGAYNE